MKLAVLVVALFVVAGCGSGDGGERQQTASKLPQQLASELAEQSDVVAERLEANDPCGAQAEAEALQERTIASVNEGRVPPRYQEELTSAVSELVATIECVRAEAPPPPTVEEEEDQEEENDDDEESEGQGKGDRGQSGKGGGKGKGKGGGYDGD